MRKGLLEDHYWRSREWPYKDIPHKIIAEKFLDDHTGKELNDYKWWCFNGEPRVMYRTIKSSNYAEIFENFYDMDFNPLYIDHGFSRHTPEFDRPEQFEEMRGLACRLSEGIPFVRIDFFVVEGQVYFSEYTFYDWSGMRKFGGDWDKKLGEMLKL